MKLNKLKKLLEEFTESDEYPKQLVLHPKSFNELLEDANDNVDEWKPKFKGGFYVINNITLTKSNLINKNHYKFKY